MLKAFLRLLGLERKSPSALIAVGEKGGEVLVRQVVPSDVPLDARVSDIFEQPDSYEGKGVSIAGSVYPLGVGRNGWWHTIKDGSGEMRGFSRGRLSGEGFVEGTVIVLDNPFLINMTLIRS